MPSYADLQLDELIDLLSKETIRYNELLRKLGAGSMNNGESEEYKELKKKMQELNKFIQAKKGKS